MNGAIGWHWPRPIDLPPSFFKLHPSILKNLYNLLTDLNIGTCGHTDCTLHWPKHQTLSMSWTKSSLKFLRFLRLRPPMRRSCLPQNQFALMSYCNPLLLYPIIFIGIIVLIHTFITSTSLRIVLKMINWQQVLLVKWMFEKCCLTC